VVGPCEHGNEPFGSLKDVVFLDYEFLLASQERTLPHAVI